MEDSVVAAYVALLLGCILQENEVLIVSSSMPVVLLCSKLLEILQHYLLPVYHLKG